MDDNVKDNGNVSERKIKQWSKLKGENSWTMFKVISEFSFTPSFGNKSMVNAHSAPTARRESKT